MAKQKQPQQQLLPEVAEAMEKLDHLRDVMARAVELKAKLTEIEKDLDEVNKEKQDLAIELGLVAEVTRQPEPATRKPRTGGGHTFDMHSAIVAIREKLKPDTDYKPADIVAATGLTQQQWNNHKKKIIERGVLVDAGNFRYRRGD